MLNLKEITLGSIAFTIVFTSFYQEVNSTENIIVDKLTPNLACLQDWDKNKGHGNDPYIEFTMNVESIGQIDISGDFDIDNPGTSLDKQMMISANSQEILWSSLNNSQKQQIEDELRRQVCLALNIFPD